MNLFDIVQKALLAGFGAQEKVREFVDELVKKGELSKSEGAKAVRVWAEKVDKSKEQLSKGFSELVTKTIEKMNLATKNDIKELNKRIENLSNMIKKLEGEKKEQ